MTRTVGKFVSLLIVLFALTAPGCVDTANDETLVRDIAFLSNGDAVAALRDGRTMKSTDRVSAIAALHRPPRMADQSGLAGL